jgi:hypothetical protein
MLLFLTFPDTRQTTRLFIFSELAHDQVLRVVEENRRLQTMVKY